LSPTPFVSPYHSTTSTTEVQDQNTHPMLTCAKVGIYKHKVFTTSVSNNYLEHSYYKQVMNHPQWLHAIQGEFDALL